MEKSPALQLSKPRILDQLVQPTGCQADHVIRPAVIDVDRAVHDGAAVAEDHVRHVAAQFPQLFGPEDGEGLWAVDHLRRVVEVKQDRAEAVDAADNLAARSGWSHLVV